MHPFLIHTRYLSITSYSACMILGFVVATLWAGYRARAAGLDANHCPALALWVIPASLAGAKVFALAHYLWQGGSIPLEFWYLRRMLLGGGLIAYGGVLGGAAAAFAYMKSKRLDFLAYADVYAPALGLGVAVMRLGCFFAGCCWGKGDSGLLAVSFPLACRAGVFQASHGYSGLFPSQLLAVFDGLMIMAIILVIESRVRIKGLPFAAFASLYAMARFGEDFTRSYMASEKMLGLTYNQWVGLAVLLTVVAVVSRSRSPGRVGMVSRNQC